MDSAIGLSTMIVIGPDQFREMLAGFHAIDEHFRTAPFDRNLPVRPRCSRSGTTIFSSLRLSPVDPTSNTSSASRLLKR